MDCIRKEKEIENNVSGFTSDITNYIRKKDYTSALILINDLKRYIIKLKKK